MRWCILPLVLCALQAQLVSSRHHSFHEAGVTIESLHSDPNVDLSRCGNDHMTMCGLPKARWLVITKQRSGSRWLVDSMTERTGGIVPYTSEINCKSCSCGLMDTKAGGAEDNQCFCHLAHTYTDFAQLEPNDNRCPAPEDEHHYGFKLMIPHHTDPKAFAVLVRSICELGIPVAFMWRRNVLRRIISSRANHLVKKEDTSILLAEGDTVVPAHPKTQEDAELLRESFKPELRSDQLRVMIQDERAGEHAVEQAFASLSATCEVARNARTFYYEDLVDGAPGAEGKWGELLASLKVWVPSNLTVIHADLPVLETVANPEQVKDALKRSQYKWMLEL
mmetsp:Transcript_36065/g.102100  ORF Transcript_36065/g.102100 Transcript_36065/m.102100 type:complete len:336 (-) Transcript_36065:146-1153(-)|eukprot:CAMPEP_0117677552 /NCGR_PEP_ID=MMETSP0804-20121206/16806_1 /TAXON_ID=1074897 /ORGANISM="Tetraselmis astigmatica, Strain CCMP880" /LENGTH=335 /DNA_ID=CAMNT_0005486843 /DNA_START=183 /DNA_END=1190 /DNA_ORIENTATION=+